MNYQLLTDSVFKIILRKPHYSGEFVSENDSLLPPPPLPMPILRRTSRGIDCWNREPYDSYNMPCRLGTLMKKNTGQHGKVVIRSVEVFKFHNGLSQWYPMIWGFDTNTLDIHYWVTSYMSGDHHYINEYPDTFEIIRLQFGSILIYCILKLKLLGRKKIKQRYLRTLLPDSVYNRREHLRSRLGFIMTTSQRSLIRKRIIQFLIG